MAVQSIQVGIDLGTTNSSVAINRDGKIEIVKKPGGVEYTPSVFGFNKGKNKVVGQSAYDALYKDPSNEEVKNYKPEVKRVMGTPEKFYFERVDVEMNAEQISAEILKSLKEDVLRKYPEFDTTGVVITIPAAFSILQSEATKRAGNLAGFKHVVLLQEPIAAAISYGFTSDRNENWLIYDFGGGTFDVALISSKDGVLSVLGHSGDNFLGGKNFDWEIVDKIIVPQLSEKFKLPTLSRDNEKYRGAFARLKYLAEKAKIELSQYQKVTIEIDGVGEDDDGNDIYLAIDLTRIDFEKLIHTVVDRTVELSKEVLKEAGFSNSSVSKIILVGGPTQIPYIKQRLESELKIVVDTSVDPLTVVAWGACIFALGQRIPAEYTEIDTTVLEKGTQTIELNYETLTSESEETITGAITALKDDPHDFYIQIQSDSGTYSGPTIKLKNGKFFDAITLDQNKSNLYWLYLFDERGNIVPITPESFTITHGLSVSGAPLPHSIGVVVASKDFMSGYVSDVFHKLIEKNSILPVRKTEPFKTARRLKKKEDDNPLLIKVGEGESKIPDRNVFVCELGIKGSYLPYDLPEGTELELTVEVNESRELTVTAYIPMIDLLLNARSTVMNELIDVSSIEVELDIQIERAHNIDENYGTEEKRKVDNTIRSVTTSLRNARLDEDEKRKADKQLRDLKIMLDQMEKDKEMPELIAEFEEKAETTKNIITELGLEDDKAKQQAHLTKMIMEAEKAIRDNDKTLLLNITEQVNELRARAILSNPAVWFYQFAELIKGDQQFTNPKDAIYYTEKGKRAIESEDLEELKRCYHQLTLLLTSDEQLAERRSFSGIRH